MSVINYIFDLMKTPDGLTSPARTAIQAIRPAREIFLIRKMLK